MATQITFHPFVDGVLTMARIVQADGTADEYALEQGALSEVQAALAEAGADPPPLVRQRIEHRIRAIGWRHLPAAA